MRYDSCFSWVYDTTVGTGGAVQDAIVKVDRTYIITHLIEAKSNYSPLTKKQLTKTRKLETMEARKNRKCNEE